MEDWKSTAAGILSFLITTLTVISAFLAANTLSAGGGIGTITAPTWVLVAVNGLLALCRAWIGLITENASAGAVAKVLKPIVLSSSFPPNHPLLLAPPTAATLAATPPK
jgi:hypothetical protein